MRKRLFALILLATFGLGLVAASRASDAQTDPDRLSSPAPCYTFGNPADAVECRPAQDRDRASCCDTLCRHACHAAVIAGGTGGFFMESADWAPVEAFRAGLPPFVRAVEHVPLA